MTSSFDLPGFLHRPLQLFPPQLRFVQVLVLVFQPPPLSIGVLAFDQVCGLNSLKRTSAKTKMVEGGFLGFGDNKDSWIEIN
jgi:hypothetical protein